MPRIPTFTSTAKPTTDVGGIKSGIQISPSSTIAAKLLPSANTPEIFEAHYSIPMTGAVINTINTSIRKRKAKKHSQKEGKEQKRIRKIKNANYAI